MATKIKETKKQLQETLQVERENNKKLNQIIDNMYQNQADSETLAAPKRFLEAEKPAQINSTRDLQRFVSELYGKGLDIIGRKNRDYGDHANNDPFGNFRRHELKGFLVRIDDKISRLNTYCNTGRLSVLDESVIDTIIDAANYLAIMAAYIYSNPPKSTLGTFGAGQDISADVNQYLK